MGERKINVMSVTFSQKYVLRIWQRKSLFILMKEVFPLLHGRNSLYLLVVFYTLLPRLMGCLSPDETSKSGLLIDVDFALFA